MRMERASNGAENRKKGWKVNAGGLSYLPPASQTCWDHDANNTKGKINILYLLSHLSIGRT